MRQRRVFCTFVMLICGATCQLVACSGTKDSAKSSLGSSDLSWQTYGHDYTNQRYSQLSEIDTRSISNLRVAYVVQTGLSGSFESTPLVSNGVMYFSTPFDGVEAVDAMTGDVMWKRLPLSGTFRLCCGPVNRGVALSNDLVLIGQLDGALVALNRKTGAIKWAKAVADSADGYSITMAPLVYKGSVLIGVAGSEFGVRGFISSYSLADGDLQWRWFSTDPEHWFGSNPRLRTDAGIASLEVSDQLRKRFSDSWKHGGGGIWTTPAIDPERDALYVTTGNPWPDESSKGRPGDNLYTGCIVAIDLTSGKLKWYYQQTPHDIEDLDAASPPVLVDTLDDRGQEVSAIAEAGKTGYIYFLNRDTGKLIRRSSLFVQLSPDGKNWKGGTSWSPLSYDPRLGYLIVTTSQHLAPESGAMHREKTSLRDSGWNTGFGTVAAIDASTGRIVWQDKFDQGLVGGSASTAGGVTFVGEGNGYFDALESKTGLRLWRFQTGAGVNAAPSVFQLRGHEFVAVASGGNQQFGTTKGDAIFTFALP